MHKVNRPASLKLGLAKLLEHQNRLSKSVWKEEYEAKDITFFFFFFAFLTKFYIFFFYISEQLLGLN